MASPADVPVMTGLDIGVLVALGLGALIGLGLGFIRAGLFALSWIGAIGATIYGFPYARPIARQWIETEFFADLTAGMALFVATLVVLFVVSSLIGDWVRASRLNAVDRSLGVLAGLAATAVLIVGVYLVAVSVWTVEDRPKWMREARSLQLIEPAAALFLSMLPEGLGTDAKKDAAKGAKDGKPGRTRVIQDLMAPAPKAPQPPAGAPPATAPGSTGRGGNPGAGGDSGVYDDSQRRQMERLHDSIQRR